MNILIKLTCLIGLVIAPILGQEMPEAETPVIDEVTRTIEVEEEAEPTTSEEAAPEASAETGAAASVTSAEMALGISGASASKDISATTAAATLLEPAPGVSPAVSLWKSAPAASGSVTSAEKTLGASAVVISRKSYPTVSTPTTSVGTAEAESLSSYQATEFDVSRGKLIAGIQSVGTPNHEAPAFEIGLI